MRAININQGNNQIKCDTKYRQPIETQHMNKEAWQETKHKQEDKYKVQNKIYDNKTHTTG